MNFFWGVGCLTSENSFDFDADLDLEFLLEFLLVRYRGSRKNFEG